MDHIDINRLKTGEVNLGVCKYYRRDSTLISLEKDLNHGRSIPWRSDYWR